MRKLIILLFISHLCFAFKLEIFWSKDFYKELHLTCTTIGCFDGEDTHIIDEDVCDECFSDSPNSTFIFNKITDYIYTGSIINEGDFMNYLLERKYISIDYKSPYDLISNRSPVTKRLIYQGLCPNQYDAIIFFYRTYFDTYSRPEVIYCGDEIYEAILF